MSRHFFCSSVMMASLSLGVVAGCNSSNKKEASTATSAAQPMGEKTLYERLGGEPAITAVCEDFVGRAASDPKVNFFRKDIPGVKEWKPSDQDLATFKKHLVQFV